MFDEASSAEFDFDRAVQALAGAIDVLPQMQWRPHPVPFGLGRPAWVADPGFDIRNHIHRTRVPQPGTKAQLCRTISEVTSEPVPPGLPPWELWFIEGYQGGKVVAALKMNHALADGGRLVELLDLLTRPDPGAAPSAVPVPHPRRRSPASTRCWPAPRNSRTRFGTPSRGACAACGRPAAELRHPGRRRSCANSRSSRGEVR